MSYRLGQAAISHFANKLLQFVQQHSTIYPNLEFEIVNVSSKETHDGSKGEIHKHLVFHAINSKKDPLYPRIVYVSCLEIDLAIDDLNTTRLPIYFNLPIYFKNYITVHKLPRTTGLENIISQFIKKNDMVYTQPNTYSLTIPYMEYIKKVVEKGSDPDMITELI